VPVAAGIAGLECSPVSHDELADLEPARPFRLHVNLNAEIRRVVPGAGHPGDEDLALANYPAPSATTVQWSAHRGDIDRFIEDVSTALRGEGAERVQE
jgi:hypothetical protein